MPGRCATTVRDALKHGLCALNRYVAVQKSCYDAHCGVATWQHHLVATMNFGCLVLQSWYDTSIQ